MDNEDRKFQDAFDAQQRRTDRPFTYAADLLRFVIGVAAGVAVAWAYSLPWYGFIALSIPGGVIFAAFDLESYVEALHEMGKRGHYPGS